MSAGTPPPPPGATEPQDATPDGHHFPCPACGANFRFDPASGMLVCGHCGNTAALEVPRAGPWGAGPDTAIREMDFAAAVEARLASADLEVTQVLSCTNCGAQVEFEADIHATECPFCASPLVGDTGPNRHIKPEGILPFALEEATARKAMTDWLGRLWFAPSGLVRYARRGRRMDGIYIPYWTFDANTRSAYSGQRGTIYYETRSVMRNGKRQTESVQKIRWRSVRGRVARAFDDVLVIGSRSLPRKFTDALPPWDLSALQPYRPQFIAGFRAEAYRVALDAAYNDARAHMNRVIERDVRFDIGGDTQRIQQVETQVSDVTFKHILLPIWVAAYRYNGKSYRFLVNGQTGRVQGERPWSAVKIAIAVLAGLLAAAAVGYLYAVNEGLVSP